MSHHVKAGVASPIKVLINYQHSVLCTRKSETLSIIYFSYPYYYSVVAFAAWAVVAEVVSAPPGAVDAETAAVAFALTDAVGAVAALAGVVDIASVAVNVSA